MTNQAQAYLASLAETDFWGLKFNPFPPDAPPHSILTSPFPSSSLLFPVYKSEYAHEIFPHKDSIPTSLQSNSRKSDKIADFSTVLEVYSFTLTHILTKDNRTMTSSSK